MEDLIEALQIFLKYSDDRWPTDCEHDVLRINVNPDAVSKADIEKLKKLDFDIDEEYDCFSSFRFGSA